MPSAALKTKRSEPRERPIENAIMACPEGLLPAYRGALAIRHMKPGKPYGVVDVVLLPKSGPHRLVLVEVKARGTGDSGPDIVKQLRKYREGGAQFGQQGLGALASYARIMALARAAAEKAHTSLVEKQWISAQHIWQVTSNQTLTRNEAWAWMYAAPPIGGNKVGLYLALNYEPGKALQRAIQELYDMDKVAVGIAVVKKNEPIKMIWPEGSPEAKAAPKPA